MPLNLYKPKGYKNYYIRGTIAGTYIHESTGIGSKAKADAYRVRRETEILERHAFGAKATLTFAEAATTYMKRGGETRFLGPILEHFGPDTRVRDIDNEAIEEAADALYPTAAASTLNRQLVTPISAVITLAAENGKAEWRKFRRWKGGAVRTRWLTPTEMDRLLDQAAPHLVPILACLIGGGCRASEALAIQARYFYPDTGEAWLEDTKNGHPRMMKLPGRARDLITSTGLPETGALFCTPKGQPYVQRDNGGGQIQTAFNTARDAAGLGDDVTPHVLRHTWATWYYAATRDFGGLMDLGGWRTSSCANRYRKIAPDNLADQLQDHGWDFTRLGRNIPAPAERQAGLRLVK
jgi:integrase